MNFMDTWDLLMEYFMFVIAGAVGGISLAILLDTNLVGGAKPFLIIFYLFFFFLTYLLFAKFREIAKKKNDKKKSNK